jgi:hypothetical protein
VTAEVPRHNASRIFMGVDVALYAAVTRSVTNTSMCRDPYRLIHVGSLPATLPEATRIQRPRTLLTRTGRINEFGILIIEAHGHP